MGYREVSAKSSQRPRNARGTSPHAAFIEFSQLPGGMLFKPAETVENPLPGVPQLVDITAWNGHAVIAKSGPEGSQALFWSAQPTMLGGPSFFFDRGYAHVSVGVINHGEAPLTLNLLAFGTDESYRESEVTIPPGESTLVFEDIFPNNPLPFIQVNTRLHGAGYASIDYLTLVP